MILVKRKYQHLYSPDIFLYHPSTFSDKNHIRTIFDKYRENGYRQELFEIDIEEIHLLTGEDLTEEQLEFIGENYIFASHFIRGKKVLKKEHAIIEEGEMMRLFQYHLDPELHYDSYDRFLRMSKDYYRRNRSERFKKRVQKLIEKRKEEILKPVFYDFYGKENVSIEEKNQEIRVKVYYGDTTISNLKTSHPIKDLYLMFIFRSNKLREGFGFSYLYGVRSTITESERRIGYQHSHLPRMSDEFSRFCVGSSQAGAFTVEKLSTKEDCYEKLEEFLITVDHFIQFEDLSNPFVKISELRPSLVPIIGLTGLVREVTERFRKIIIKNSEVSVNDSKADNLVVDLKIKDNDELLNSVPDSLKAVKSPDGKYYEYRQYMRLVSKVQKGDEEKIIESYPLDAKFKGETITRKVIPDNKKTINSEPEVRINPYAKKALTEYYQNQITNIINEYVKNKKQRKEEVAAKSN